MSLKEKNESESIEKDFQIGEESANESIIPDYEYTPDPPSKEDESEEVEDEE